jgi:hypothetical protein
VTHAMKTGIWKVLEEERDNTGYPVITAPVYADDAEDAAAGGGAGGAEEQK